MDQARGETVTEIGRVCASQKASVRISAEAVVGSGKHQQEETAKATNKRQNGARGRPEMPPLRSPDSLRTVDRRERLATGVAKGLSLILVS